MLCSIPKIYHCEDFKPLPKNTWKRVPLSDKMQNIENWTSLPEFPPNNFHIQTASFLITLITQALRIDILGVTFASELSLPFSLLLQAASVQPLTAISALAILLRLFSLLQMPAAAPNSSPDPSFRHCYRSLLHRFSSIKYSHIVFPGLTAPKSISSCHSSVLIPKWLPIILKNNLRFPT